MTKLNESAARETVYRFILVNWAVNKAEIIEGTNLPKDAVTRALKQLERSGIVAGERVNMERVLTYQTYFDIENDDEAETKGMEQYHETFPNKEDKMTRKNDGTPRNDTVAQTDGRYRLVFRNASGKLLPRGPRTRFNKKSDANKEAGRRNRQLTVSTKSRWSVEPRKS